MSLLNVGIHARVSKGVMARCLGSVWLPEGSLAKGVRGMLKRTSLIVAGASLAMMSCAIAGGDPGAATSASGNGNSAATQANASVGSAKTADTKENMSTTANTSSSSGTQSFQNGGGEQGGGEQGFEAVENDELVIDTDSLADRDGMGSIQVQWQISDDGDNWMVLPEQSSHALFHAMQKSGNFCEFKSHM